MISEEENCEKQKSDNVTAGNNIVDSYYWKCYVRSGRSIISAFRQDCRPEERQVLHF